MTGGVESAGPFRVYLGVAAGAGKTVAMLGEGQRRRGRGADVVIAFVECHGRPVTEQRTAGLEVIPGRAVTYRGNEFREMDLDGVLRRRPQVALVDELAHTNVPGSGRNGKRWQDVLELLDAGIEVITTVNIQHLEGIADTVEHLTKVPVRERVPDWVVRRADQIELIDSSPEQLRRRMLHGNIYPAEQVPRALGQFFRADNLAVLRELALRFVADQTGAELAVHLARHRRPGPERILAGVTPAPGSILIRAAVTAQGAIELSVADRGPGVDASRRDEIFGLFARRDDDAGAGLGLTIAKTFVEAHGQRIWVEDAAGGGARFCFTLPAAAPITEPITGPMTQESQLAASSHH